MDLAKLEEEEAHALRTTRQTHGVVLPMSDNGNDLDVDEAPAAAAEDSERNVQARPGLNHHTT